MILSTDPLGLSEWMRSFSGTLRDVLVAAFVMGGVLLLLRKVR